MIIIIKEKTLFILLVFKLLDLAKMQTLRKKTSPCKCKYINASIKIIKSITLCCSIILKILKCTRVERVHCHSQRWFIAIGSDLLKTQRLYTYFWPIFRSNNGSSLLWPKIQINCSWSYATSRLNIINPSNHMGHKRWLERDLGLWNPEQILLMDLERFY